MEDRKELFDWLKKELEIDHIQAIMPPSEDQLREIIKECLEFPFMRELFQKVVELSDYQENKRKYKAKLRFIKECFNCNAITTHVFNDVEDTKTNRLKCLNCNHIGYYIERENFNIFYDEQKIGIGELILLNC